MIDQLNSENNAMFKIWASREKQICTVLKNIPILFESIKWILTTPRFPTRGYCFSVSNALIGSISHPVFHHNNN